MDVNIYEMLYGNFDRLLTKFVFEFLNFFFLFNDKLEKSCLYSSFYYS